LLQIDGCIQVAVNHKTATFTLILAFTQAHDWFHLATLGTTFCGWVKPIGKQDLTAMPGAFVNQLPPELVHAYIRNCLRKVMVLQHPAHIQVLQHNR
jgi:hypothetical protein